MVLTDRKNPDALVEIEATLAGMQARDGMETARVRRESLVRHFDRIRAK
ncbi:MAG: hypothetical protein KFF68_15735 [Desulfosarcina sp.]|nr:hypothetical protein [Desulfosarcina sp.]